MQKGYLFIKPTAIYDEISIYSVIILLKAALIHFAFIKYNDDYLCNDISLKPEEKDVKLVIFQDYAQNLLNQNKALLSILIFKNCIIVPVNTL